MNKTPPTKQTAAKRPGMPLTAGLRVLVVDDSPFIRNLLAAMLRNLGFTDTVLARDGNEAREIIIQGGIDLVLADWLMPGSSGLDLLAHCRDDPKYARLPFILITAEGQRDMVSQAARLGVQGILIKPVTELDLLRRVRSALEQCGRAI